MNRIAIVTVNYRNSAETIACLDSLAASGGEGIVIFLIENGSGDGSAAILDKYLASYPIPVEFRPMSDNLGFAAGSNLGIREALESGSSHVVLLNNDTRVDPDFTAALHRAVAKEPLAVIAGYIGNFETGRPAHNFGTIGKWSSLVRFHFPERHGAIPPFDFVSACLMVVPAEIFRKVGLLKDEFFLYCEDMEFSLRLKEAGIRLRYDSGIGIRHKVSSTVSKTDFPKDYYRMRNHTFTVMHMRSGIQKMIYLGRVGVVLLLKLGNRRLFRQFWMGAKDGLAGRLGHRAEPKT